MTVLVIDDGFTLSDPVAPASTIGGRHLTSQTLVKYPAAGCADMLSFVRSNSNATRAKDIIRNPGRTIQINGVTQVNGADTPRRKAILYKGHVHQQISGATEDVFFDNLVGNDYELVVFGDGARRSEVWGPTTIPAPTPMELSGSLAACTASVAYSSGLTLTGGNGTKTWYISGQALPAGLGFSTSTGVISGTTAVTGTTLHTIGVRDGNNVLRWKDVTLVVS